MTDLFRLPKLPGTWPPQALRAFAEIKKRLSTDVLLHYPDFDHPFAVVSDASLNGTGAVLLQDLRPVAFTSKKFSPAERNYGTGEQELLGVVNALREWRCYLLSGISFTLVTDHHPLTYLKTQATLGRRQARWLDLLEEFKFDWVYRPGRLNVVADALSRLPSLAHIVCGAMRTRRHPEQPTSSTDADSLFSRIVEATERDAWFQDPRHTDSLLRHSTGFYQKQAADCEFRVVVPNDPSLKRDIISRAHSSELSGHPGRDRTLKLLQRTFWWPTMGADVADFVASCDTCQRVKPASGKPPGLAQPLPVPDMPWESVSLDLITGLPTTQKGHNAILVLVDRLTKMVHVVPCKKTLSAEQTADAFFETIVRLHGMPKIVVGDRDTRWTGLFIPALLKRCGARLNLSTAFHPQTDGQTERMNRTLQDMLRAFTSDDPRSWDRFLPAAEFAINNLPNRTTGQSPFYLNYGFHPRTPLQLELGDVLPAAKAFADNFSDRIRTAQRQMTAAQDRAKAYQDQRRRDVEFAVGQQVLLSTRNFKVQKGQRKLLPRWTGPFEMTEMINPVAARLALPADYPPMHDVFHVSLLRQYQPPAEGAAPPPIIAFDPTTMQPVLPTVEKILNHETKKLRTKTLHRYYVLLRGRSHGESQWWDEADLLPEHQALLDAYWAAQPNGRTADVPA